MSGEISDGYGDQLNVGEWLDRIEPFIGMVQAERHRPGHPAERDDVMQEARIAVWRALGKKPADPRTYLIATVKKRTIGVMSRLDWTGQPSQQGKPSVDPLRRQDRDSLDDPNTFIVAVAVDALEAVELAYHHGEVHDAIRNLPERARAYVVLRFWHGMSEAEIAAHLGVSKSVANNLWNRDARPVLREHLDHLSAYVLASSYAPES